jgi:N-acetylneuraminic acid mutarotase
MCYNCTGNSWEFLADLPVAVDHHAVALIQDTLYIIGGHNGSDLNTFNTVFGYCISTQTWSEKASLPISLAAGAAMAFNDKIYLFGGTDAFIGHAARNYYPDVLVYDPAVNTWQAAGPFLNTREHLTCLLVDDLIYIIGGRIYHGSGFTTYDRIETYDPNTSEWDYVTSLPAASSGLLAANLETTICFFGGEDLTDHTMVDLHHAFNTVTGEWIEIRQIPIQRHGITAVTIGEKIHVLGGGKYAYSAIATKSHFVLSFDKEGI